MGFDDIGYMLEDLLDGIGGLILPALVLIGGFILFRRFRKQAQRGGDELMPAGDPMRYALASAVLKGSPFRRKIINLFENPFRAKAPELGLDLPILLAAARRMEAADRRWQWAFFFLLAYPFLIAPFVGILIFNLLDAMDVGWRGQRNAGSVLGLVNMACFIAVFVLAIVKQWLARFRDVKPFRRENYNPVMNQERFPPGPDMASTFNPGKSNILTFGSTDPFVGLGVRVGNWQVAVDLTRPAQPGGAPGTIQPDDVHRAVAASVRSLGLPRLAMSDLGFVNGTESSTIDKIQPDRFSPPRHQVSDHDILADRNNPDSKVRVYNWLRIPSPDGEVQLNYLFRCARRGDSLLIEAVQTVLPPVVRGYREVDFIRRLGFLGMIQWASLAIIAIPLVILRNLSGVLGQVRDFISNLFGGAVAAERLEIKLNPAYNYGASQCVREHMMARDYQIYFQRADGTQFNQAIDQQVLNAVRDMLNDAGIDTQAFGEQAVQIQQSNVTFNTGGGNVNVAGSANVGGFVSQIGKVLAPARS